MLLILHGYLLDGSGSNLWTLAIIRALCKEGNIVHLMCQENHPELYDFIHKVYIWKKEGEFVLGFNQNVDYPGHCIMHKPKIGDTLPVYVHDMYEEFSNVVPMIELSDDVINEYLEINVRTVMQITQKYDITAIHANHAVLMSVAAERVSNSTNIPFSIIPHGSALEYAVKKDVRFHQYAKAALEKAQIVFTIGKEIQTRLESIFPSISNLEEKMVGLNLGVDTELFKVIPNTMRSDMISTMVTNIQNLERGKTHTQTLELINQLSKDVEKEQLAEIFKKSSEYSLKCPDHALEEKLKNVNWEKENILLFVGRLIASKGFHAILAALPLILEKKPNTRLIVVGHGPLREPMEALVYALSANKPTLVKTLVKWTQEFEDSPSNLLKEINYFYTQLEKENQFVNYFEKAETFLDPKRVLFTGYLTHNELCYLFPCCDIAIFPSIVAEAGPLVFLEALASGCFPLGTYFAGMGASIDSVASYISPKDINSMKLNPKPELVIQDIVKKSISALEINKQYKNNLRRAAEEKYDWKAVAHKFSEYLKNL